MNAIGIWTEVGVWYSEAVDTTSPIITLIGDSEVIVPYGQSYTELGANVVDDIETGLSVVITGTLNPSNYGVDQYVYYNASDGTNSAIEVRRTVVFENIITSSITISGSPIPIPDGNYRVVLSKKDEFSKAPIHDNTVAITNNSITISGLVVPSGTAVFGQGFSSINPVQNAILIHGVTE